jgi:hypothetical protein
MREFIRANREELDKMIKGSVPNGGKLNDREREQWILNDEGLYRWARRAGVPV